MTIKGNESASEARITLAAVDVGGTFTDLLGIEDGRLVALKVPSTPRAPELGVIDALGRAGAVGCSLVHGSTVATNAVLERKGPRTAFITTEGFSDLIEIGRQDRSHLYRLHVSRPEPLVRRSLRFEASERVAPGRVLKRLTRAEARRVAQACADARVESAAVCLLFSFEQPAHEEMLREELERLGIDASLSSFVLPEFREYERASTTVVNAYVAPVIKGYLSRLASALDDGGRGRLRLMHSAGGTTSAEMASRRAADLVLSGPAGGVVASRWLAASTGAGDVISFDMGGTSTDVSLVSGDEVTVTRETCIGGLPVALPMVDINTIGAGGGSIAFLDRAGVLKVGPESAGADPGPACYGKGALPTVTDANLVLGRLEPSWFLGGRMRLLPERSARAFESLAGKGEAVSAARATIDVALSHMEAAVKEVSLERGHDPREFALVAFGGAGPMHACELADRLEIPRVLVPVHPGLFSSMGMLLADAGRDHTRTFLSKLDAGCAGALGRVFSELEDQAVREMAAEGFARSSLRFQKTLSMRYRGQSHEIEVTVRRLTAASILRHFEEAYVNAYGYLRERSDVEVVNVRLSCRAPQAEVPLTPPAARATRGRALARRAMYFGSRRLTGGVFSRWDLAGGQAIAGPAIIVQEDSTTVVPPGWRAALDILGNLDVEVTR
jgi:N-methylhydantoinase A